MRWTEGLESERQFPYLELIVEIEMARGAWDNVEDKLKHYTALLGKKYHGDAQTRLGHMLWLADTHAQGALADISQRRAYHLMQATRVSEIAVQYAQVRRLTLKPVYPELLFAVARAYDMENAGIRERGSVSYRLREIAPGTDILEERKVAIAKRYQFGREKLLMMRDAIRDSEHFDDEAVLASEIISRRGVRSTKRPRISLQRSIGLTSLRRRAGSVMNRSTECCSRSISVSAPSGA